MVVGESGKRHVVGVEGVVKWKVEAVAAAIQKDNVLGADVTSVNEAKHAVEATLH